MFNEASIARLIGSSIFHVRPAKIEATHLYDDMWKLEKEGVCVVGKLTSRNSKSCFEITEGDRELVGRTFTI